MLKKISIHGLRGFGEKEEIEFSLPNTTIGSGLNVIVGPNNSGKTTITEAIRFYNCNPYEISFSEGKRNKKNNENIEIMYHDNNDRISILKTVENGGSQVELHGDLNTQAIPYVLQSRRHAKYIMYNKYEIDRESYLQNQSSNFKNRMSDLSNYDQRIFKWQRDKNKFDPVIQKLITDSFDWTIEQNDDGGYYVKVMFANKTVIHTREGIGDGYWSMFTIADVLYDSEPGKIIVIDEPELSLHPAFQKNVLKLLEEYAKDRQIIITTHSPYFISIKSLLNGGSLIRTYKDEKSNIKIGKIEEEDKEFIKSITTDIHNPHAFGLDARELFFIEDNIVITEGQEDVVIIPKICEDINIDLEANLYGWGIGGAEKIEKILNILKKLNYKKVTAIYDRDKPMEFFKCKMKFPQYNVVKLFEDDIRDKKEGKVIKKKGVTDSAGNIKEENIIKMKIFLNQINGYHLTGKKRFFSFNKLLKLIFGKKSMKLKKIK